MSITREDLVALLKEHEQVLDTRLTKLQAEQGQRFETLETNLKVQGEQLNKRLDKRLDKQGQRLETLETNLKVHGEQLNDQVKQLKTQSDEHGRDLNKVSRTVNAIESFPIPYGRPKVFFSATEMHSSIAPVRVRQGSQG